jgi:hypothetical protein
MRLRVILLATLFLVGACASGSPPRDWGDEVAKAHGALEFTPERVRYLRFDFVVRKGGVKKAEFRHLLDRKTGAYRYEADAATFAGVPFLDGETNSWRPIGLDLPEGRLVALGNRRERTGRVWISGVEQPPELAERVRQRIDNDAWWLILPLALSDPNLRVRSDGPAMLEGQGEAVELNLTFAPDAGDTPGDVYRIFIDPASLEVLRTEIDLQNRDVTLKADWAEQTVLSGVRFYRKRQLPDRTLAFENLDLPTGVVDGVFTDPSVAMSDGER